MLLEANFTPNEEEAELITFFISKECPYYYHVATGSDGEPFYAFCHVLKRRAGNEQCVEGVVNSDLYPQAEKLFRRVCTELSVEPKTILRAAVNCTSHSNHTHGGIHVDHNGFEHYNFILYLDDSGGDTFLFGDKATRITSSKNKVAIFKGQPHAQGFCPPDKYRFVMIFTFTI